jgi:MOSC domain-containing protein YiiM
MPGQLIAIWTKRAHRGPMDGVAEAELEAGRGVRGSADQGGKRQITVIDEAAWLDATAEAGGHVDSSKRRANVLLRGLDLRNSRGRMLRLGQCTVRVHGETRPCERMDEALPGLREAMKSEWRGGVYGEIVDGGTIRVGDTAEWIEEKAEMSGE